MWHLLSFTCERPARGIHIFEVARDRCARCEQSLHGASPHTSPDGIISSSAEVVVVVRVVGSSSGLLPMFWSGHGSGASLWAVEHAPPVLLLGAPNSGWIRRACQTSSQWQSLASVTW